MRDLRSGFEHAEEEVGLVRVGKEGLEGTNEAFMERVISGSKKSRIGVLMHLKTEIRERLLALR